MNTTEPSPPPPQILPLLKRIANLREGLNLVCLHSNNKPLDGCDGIFKLAEMYLKLDERAGAVPSGL